MDNLNLYFNISTFVKKFVLPLGANSIIKKIIFNKKKKYAILCYHRVVEDDYFFKNISPLKGLCVSKKNFFLQIKFLKENFKIVSLDQLYNHISNNSNSFVISITFDDGYKDNLTNALPILEQFEVPFSIFVVTRFLEGDTFMWWYELWDLINDAQYIIFNNKNYKSNTTEKKINVFKFFSNILINLNLYDQKFLLRKLKNSKINVNYKHLCLDWKEVQFLSKHKLVTIGNHTYSHLRLSKLNKISFFKEIIESRNILEKKLKFPIKYIAYPFGGNEDVSRENLLFTKKENYILGFSTRVSPTETDFFNIPRYNVDNQISIKALESKINGFEDLLISYKRFF